VIGQDEIDSSPVIVEISHAHVRCKNRFVHV
jgi:hypothetical protein